MTISSLTPDPVPVNTMIHLPFKLTSTNYLLWKHQLDSMLMCFDLKGFVSGMTHEPSDVSNNNLTYKIYFISIDNINTIWYFN